MTKKELENKVIGLEERFAFHVGLFNEYCVFLGTEISRLEQNKSSATDRLSSDLPIDPPPNLSAAKLTQGSIAPFNPLLQIKIPGSKVTGIR